ncbi:MAG: hypothetical protein ACRCXM_04365, partial [Beijerinckiaceae bacterium]
MTPAQIKALTPAEQTQLMIDLGKSIYGEVWRPQFQSDFDLHRSTVEKWMKNHTVPLMALLALSAMSDTKSGSKAQLAEDLAEVAQLMQA